MMIKKEEDLPQVRELSREQYKKKNSEAFTTNQKMREVYLRWIGCVHIRPWNAPIQSLENRE